MREFVKPIVVLSKCLEFEACRYDGQVISDALVKQLAPYVTFIPVCPEVEIGLGVPRDPIQIVSVNGDERLIQPATGRDLSDAMLSFAHRFLSSLDEVDGFILKSRSPSCGIKDVKAYLSIEKGAATTKSSGFFARKILERFPGLAIEDERRLTSFKVRDHFLTKLFALASLRAAKKSHSLGALVRFHAVNKLLLMAYNQKEMRILGRIAANRDKKAAAEVIADYEHHFKAALLRGPKSSSNVNVLMHGLGHFSKQLSSQEKAFFLEVLEKYRSGKIPLCAPVKILQNWIIRFENHYLMEQTFFEPYPEDLMLVPHYVRLEG